MDDSKENLLFMETALASDNYQVRVAPNGRLALRSIAHEAPDLILLDINMPGMDGYEVCRRIRKIDGLESLPVVFISGSAGERLKEKVSLAGGSGLLEKPFGVQELLVMLRQFLSKGSAHSS